MILPVFPLIMYRLSVFYILSLVMIANVLRSISLNNTLLSSQSATLNDCCPIYRPVLIFNMVSSSGIFTFHIYTIEFYMIV